MPKRVPRPPNGLEFPVDKAGKRSTTAINQATFAAAVEAVSKDDADKARNQRGWRFAYNKHVVKNVELSARSPEAAMKVARAGLHHLHQSFEFIRDGTTTSLSDGMSTLTADSFHTGIVEGEEKGAAGGPVFGVPYHGHTLVGDDLTKLIQRWVEKGVIEKDCGEALSRVSSTPGWLDLSDTYFVLLGASSAMGPLPLLLSLGANIIAIDLDRAPIWKKVINMARASRGKLFFPLSKPQSECTTDDELFKAAGSDLLAKTPEIRNWLLEVCPGEELVVGAYAYLDGPLFVRVSMAMDAIIKDLTEKRKGTALAYLCTPTDCHLTTPEAEAAARKNLCKAPLWQKALAAVLSVTKWRMKPCARKPIACEDGSTQHVVDAIVPQQGPNYILAKRLQHWRAMVAREDNKCRVSSNIAPSTATLSVLSNFSFKLAYGGMRFFRPVEVTNEDTSNAVMGALLINDLRYSDSAANPSKQLSNPLNLFTETSFHGGAWRGGYHFGTIGTGCVISFLISHYVVAAWLLLYNIIQCLGWGYAFVMAVQSLQGGVGLWAASGTAVYTLTMWTQLEVVHSMLGMVRAPVPTTFIQVLSRVLMATVVEQCNGAVFTLSSYPFLHCMVFAWSITEVVRYMFYAMAVAGVDFYPVKWLRYSMFLILYPLGVTGEVGCLYAALKNGAFRVVSKDAPALMTYFAAPLFSRVPFWPFVVLVWGGGLAVLYSVMLVQRARALSPPRPSSKKQK